MVQLAWSAIDTVLLDMDGTLLDLHYDNYFWQQHLPQVYARQHNLSPMQAQQQLMAQFAAEQGSLNWYCTDFWTETLGLDVVQLKHQIADKIAIRPHVLAFLQALQDSGRQVILVTNAHRDSLALKMAKTQLTPFFSALVSTHDYALPKEDVRLWSMLRADFPFDPQRTLLIDDNEAILQTAQHYGIAHLLTLTQPDSQLAPRENLAFAAILHFDEIMPHD